MSATATQEDKIARLLRGERVIVSDDDMDVLEQDERLCGLRSLPNPTRAGRLDAYVAWLSPGEGSSSC